ncbi:MAG: thiamine biosynthesis protein ThiF [Sulfurimonas sp. RIFOXYB2_FULL_37_5]|uniref:thiamine biosynthesis protein ThiF n=1 Tax=Sulfurimonas sp. RIFOXYB12_FULL_35_9 TaxID=1802256 RepID=UPI0008C4DE10|nr:thiamine biosynthesis protein ThiF [Sulfurimonas sp. RIFOXYB12_FULL_35_9]OHE04517.1 MAG: thiamine biosynthesis protein ThiF [Sulfurimonas sp. RIFOXYB12_FULL_35_9]OHE12644.1 MAG: thiamine biosynthesis protein ThiF [Sulfurimonas sp. RIFOXYB2_FULL_37_5]
MIHGFKNSPLACEGIIGDGCGGGRWFFVEDEILKAYDPISKENITLVQNIKKAKKISKKRCVITIECEDETIEFDLSQMQKK